jgi:hypothetical protein
MALYGHAGFERNSPSNRHRFSFRNSDYELWQSDTQTPRTFLASGLTKSAQPRVAEEIPDPSFQTFH